MDRRRQQRFGLFGFHPVFDDAHNSLTILGKHHRNDHCCTEKGETEKRRNSDTEHVIIPFVLSIYA
tara:strand:- start:295 stop:492 length:198 start_codon:yes stop_codon:yes gene_type:complete